MDYFCYSDWLFTVLQFILTIKSFSSYSKPSTSASTLGFNNVLSHLSVVQSGVFLWSPCDPIFFFSWRSGGTPVLHPPRRFRFPLAFVPQAVCESSLCVRRFKCIFWLCLSMYMYDKMYFFFNKYAFYWALESVFFYFLDCSENHPLWQEETCLMTC